MHDVYTVRPLGLTRTRRRLTKQIIPSFRAHVGAAEQTLIVDAGYASAFVPEIRAQWEKWAQALRKATGLNVIVKPGPATKRETLDELRIGTAHITFLDPLSYVVGRTREWLKPLAMSAPNGQAARAVMFIARTDSGLKPGGQSEVFNQLNGRRPGWPRWPWPQPTFPPLAQHILPAGLLALHGTKLAPPVFVSGDFVESSVQAAVFRRACDFAAVDAMSPADFKRFVPGTLQGMPFERWAREMQVLYITAPINPTGALVISTVVSDSARREIARAIQETPSLGTEAGYRPFDEVLFAEFERIVFASAIDLQPYIAVPYWLPDNAFKPAPSEPDWTPAPEDTVVVDVPLQGGPPFLPGRTDWLNRLVMPAIYAELVRLDATGQYMPYLAARVPTFQNGLARFVGQNEERFLEVEFPLRPNLRWHDGQRLTADDLIFSWHLATNPAWPGTRAGASASLASLPVEALVHSVIAPTPDRVIYRFMSQRQARAAARKGGRLNDPKAYAQLAQQVGPVVPLDYLEVGRNVFPKHLLADLPVEAISTSDFARRPVYAGAYRLIEGFQDQPVVLEAFADFALGEPAIKRVVFGAPFYSKAASADWQPPDALAKALRAHAIQAQLALPTVRSRMGADPRAFDALSSQSDVNVTWTARDLWEVLDFNLDNRHLRDRQVRAAIAYAIDRQALIDLALAGHGKLMRSYLPDWHPLYAGDANLPNYPYDPDRARALMTDAGYDLSKLPATHPSRGALVLELASMDVAPYARPPIASLIQRQLATIGIEVRVTFHEWAHFEGSDCSAIRNGRRFDLGMAAWLGGLGRYPVIWVEQATASTSIPTVQNGCPFEKSNWSGWRNAAADAILAKLKDGQLALENPDRYRALWAEHQRLWASELPSLPLFNVARPVVTAHDLRNVQPSPFAFGGGVEDTWNIYSWAWT